MGKTEEQTITLVCGCDDNYAPHAATMLKSAEDNLQGRNKLAVYVLHDASLSQENLESLGATLKHTTLNSLRVPEAFMAGMPTDKFHQACWHRIFIPELLPNIKRALYLDADMLVVDDLAALWNTDLEGAPFGAVSNPLYPFMPFSLITRLGITRPEDYLNTGCLLMNLESLRQLKFAATIKSYAKKHPQNGWPEQDAISALYIGQWRKLHPRWNAQNTLFELPDNKLPFTSKDLSEARQKPAIVHFIGPRKPWTYLAKHPYKNQYRHYRNQTAWASWSYNDFSVFNFLIRPLPLALQLKLEKLKTKIWA